MDELTEFDKIAGAILDARSAPTSKTCGVVRHREPIRWIRLRPGNSLENDVNDLKRVAKSTVAMALVVLATGCIVEPRDNYYDHDHHRYYSGHAWHDCGERDDHCR